MVLPEFDGIFAANVNINAPARAVRFRVVGISTGLILDRQKTVSEEPLVVAWERLKKLNDFVVNEQAEFH
jgi:hypothetical protein